MPSLEVSIPEELLIHCFWCERPHRGEHPLAVCPECTVRLTTMRLLEMSGSYPLTAAAIDDALKRKSPGNYALGYMDGDSFSVFYVGRSDSDVRAGLCSWVDKPATYGRFWSPTKAAWKTHRGRRLPVESVALDQVGNDGKGYTRFAYSYAGSAEDAYAKEWRNYDSFGGHHGLDNEVQPVHTVD
jgi:hypothetical protein